jgi:ABC-2 type transport system ATP-binding protein
LIELQNVSRWYGQVIGLNDITCKINPGLTALLGQNGAGKSTLLRLITGQLRPTTGSLTVFGMEPFANPDVYRRLGYCPEIDNFYEHNTGRQFVRFLAELSGFAGSEAADRTAAVLGAVGMLPKADAKIAGYSKGMRQRIKLAQAMLVNPDIILLDEPLNGLDPIGRREYIDLLHGLASEGKTVMVSSHILYEVEAMTSSILLLHRGRLLAEGDLRVIRSLIDRHPHRVRLETPHPRQLAAALAALPNVVSLTVQERDEAIDAEIREPETFYDSLRELAIAHSIEIRGFSSPDNNLESVFSYLVNN